MTLLWSDYRTQIRRSILKDPSATTWANDVLADLCGWALDTFCTHTAAVTASTFDPVREIPVPENLFGDVEQEAILYFWRDDQVPVVVRPLISPSSYSVSSPTFTEWNKVLTLSADPPTNANMTLRYFAHYNHPVQDADTIDIPPWAYYPVAFLVGAYAMTGVAIQSANIRQWNDKRDSGTPEDNSLRVQQGHMLRVYESEIARHPTQDRKGLLLKYLKTST